MASELEEKEAIRELMSAYCFHLDNGEFDKFAGLFTEDAIFEAGPFGKLQGRRAIDDFIKAQVPCPGEGPARKHCTFNHVIRVSGSEAHADSYIVVVRESSAGIIASLAGRYEDLLVKEAGGWRFKVRKIHFDISSDLGLKQ
ncbi:MAG: nuclear transport factor 2 family protein [Deltaproteobacteria bacterium]|nr:nuclear transport factor 2 family protein [Deltaproteobacteria bacterium]MBV8452922.1 nuclear transport factor 2 family protein [Deltaproteobacteria bacterium]